MARTELEIRVVTMSGKESEPLQSPFERAYRGLLRGLYEGRFVPGQRLVAPDLMLEFEVGRSTIREVLSRLASSGIISIVPHRGAEVRRLSRAEVGDVLDIVELLLGLAARKAAQAISPHTRHILEERHAALCAAGSKQDFTAFVHAREDYYRWIVALSDSRELQRLFPSAQVQILRTQLRPFNHAADTAVLSDFDELTKAVSSGDPACAEAAARRHVQLTVARVADLPERAFAPAAPHRHLISPRDSGRV